jgi:N-acetylglucosaminyl-diphospho-decaprenol L-rhamnosyltransferase
MNETERAVLGRVTAVVVTFNSAHCVDALAASLAQLEHVVVVDNASGDGTVARARAALPRARLIENRANLGFGAANNIGLQQADTEFALLVNPDCSFHPAAIIGLVACADRFPEASAIGPQIVDEQGRPEPTYRWTSNGWASRGPAAEAPLCVGFVTGACMLVRTDAMRRIGGFDEAFFLYYEDDDLCIRVQRDCGPLVVDPAQRVRHVSRGSVGGPRSAHAEYLRGFHHIQSKFRFHRKHRGCAVPVWRRAVYGASAALAAALRVLVFDRRRAARMWGRAMGVVKWREQ